MLRKETPKLRKENRWECLFCETFDICSRIECNPYIEKHIKEHGHCPDRKPIWVNPSHRIPFFEFQTCVYLIGEVQPRFALDEKGNPSFYYKPLLKEIQRDFR